MDDIFNVPWERGTEAAHIYEELRMKCDKEYLRDHSDFVAEIINGPKFGLEQLELLRRGNNQLRQRLDWVVVPDHAYKLASVVYFDVSENPEKYEIGYAKKKIEHWKANTDVAAFFLQKPVRTLMPFSDEFAAIFQDYSEAITKVDLHHSHNLCTKFSELPVSEVIGKP